MTRSLIAIDPGESAGLALFEADALVRVELVSSAVANGWTWDGPCGLPVVCEVPEHYRGSTVRVRDLLTLTFTAGFLSKSVHPARVSKVFPREWKGQRPKAVDNAYTLRLLTAAEARVVHATPKSTQHNILDAVGIGLWALGRR